MPMKIAIVAHKRRARLYKALIDAVKADFVGVDDGSLGAEENHRAVWKMIADITEPDEWAIVLEDDAKPVENFREAAELALATAPTDIVSLYLGRQRPAQWQDRINAAVAIAEREDAAWIVSDSIIGSVGLAVRGKLIPEMLASTGNHLDRPIDEALNQWVRFDSPGFGRPVAFAQPSLVDHADVPTLIKHPDGEPRPKGRVAWRFGPRETWNGRYVRL